ncbi:hypothetical protein DACRYDRAFT_89378 [Dacryopinax primogenitus]|uniref:Major facilitator superfamily (MFS) profile domain-containing protein n=1 Tax=Dacryopinax primogenitus (strain DJM 731) TaxID=1858805 RepID=M5FWX9_DACPD|nr:uncharacterized protein DACRYDRAFT_89378 [Dacryopinax primogenitus]EJU00929.1 hypothetical protein DACRYDRAFT_89378 [Dacryopinax primogenitus]
MASNSTRTVDMKQLAPAEIVPLPRRTRNDLTSEVSTISERRAIDTEQPSYAPSAREKEPAIIPEKQARTLPGPTFDNASRFGEPDTLVAIISALILATSLGSLDMTIVATAIPRITDEFKNLADVGWYGSAFFLTLGSFQSTWGKAYKYFPLKPAFLLAIGIFELGSLICAAAPNSTALIIGRAIAGMGASGAFSGVYTIVAFSARPEHRPSYISIIGATYGLASVIGPLLGGVFTEKLTWRWCFWINLPIGGVAAAIIAVFFSTPAAAKPVSATGKEKLLQMDPLGTGMIMGALISYLLALQWGGVTQPWSSSTIIGLLVGFVLMISAFIGIEWHMGERAILPPHLFKQRTVALSAGYIFFLTGGFFIILYFLPIYFQSVDGVSASDSGVRNIPLILGVALFTFLAGNIVTLWGHFAPLLVIGAVLATIGSGLIYLLDIGTPSPQWISYQVVAGVGIGLGLQIPISASQAMVDVKDVAPVTAMALFFQTIGGAFFISAAQAIFANRLLAVLPSSAPSIDPALVLATGASELRIVFPQEVLPGILRAYMGGLQAAFAFAIPLLGLAALLSIFVEWKSIKGHAAVGAA